MNPFRRYRAGSHKIWKKTITKGGLTIAEYCRRRYYNKKTHRKCCVCGKVKPVRMRLEEYGERKAVCPNCYAKYFYIPPTSMCYMCNSEKPVAKYSENGLPICHNCNNKKITGACRMCGQEKIIQAMGLCYGCYKKQRRAKAQNAAGK